MFDLCNETSPNAPAHKAAMTQSNKLQMVAAMRRGEQWLATWRICATEPARTHLLTKLR
jgi:hypothetical protein